MFYMSKSQKALDSLRKDPLIQKLVKTRPVFWSNPKKTDVFAPDRWICRKNDGAAAERMLYRRR